MVEKNKVQLPRTGIPFFHTHWQFRVIKRIRLTDIVPMIELAQITPPVGFNLLVISGLANEDLSIHQALCANRAQAS
jgi:hypothetical protein